MTWACHETAQEETMMAKENKTYQWVTERMIAALESGTIPWHKPWTGGFPKNIVSKKAYRGINVFMLEWSASKAEYTSPWWGTFNQWKGLGGMVRKGEKSSMVTFHKQVTWGSKDADAEKDERETYWLLRYYSVFNLNQVDMPEDWVAPDADTVIDFTPIEAAEKIVTEMPNAPSMKFGGSKAYYSPSLDVVGMPHKNTFDDEESYYSTTFHELTHSTMHPDRVHRPEGVPSMMGDHGYSFEELVAEMGAAMLCTHAGITSTFENSAAYIAGWLKRLKSDPKFVVQAAGKAQRAADYILGIEW